MPSADSMQLRACNRHDKKYEITQEMEMSPTSSGMHRAKNLLEIHNTCAATNSDMSASMHPASKDKIERITHVEQCARIYT